MQADSFDTSSREDLNARRQAFGGVTRFATADAQKALERIQSSTLLGEGKVCLMSLDAIRERLGPRWIARRDRVYDHAQQSLRRALGPHGFFLRVSEADFLVAQPGIGRVAGQALCLYCLREVLTYFLGEALLSDVIVHEVTSIDGGRIAAQTLDAQAVDAEALTLPPVAPTPPATPASSLISQDRWTPFVAHDGQRLRASCQLEPVIQLKTYGRIGYRMRRRILTLPAERPLSRADQQKLTAADLERIDFATLARGLNRLELESDRERQPSLVLPVSFTTLSSKRGRAMLAEFFRAAQESVQRGLICEVCDIEGVPPSTLLAVTSLMRPFCLFIVGRLAAPPVNGLGSLLDAGLQGVSIECPPGLESDSAFDSFAKMITAAAKPVVRAVMIYGVAGPRQAAIASLHGASHASFAPSRPKPQPADVRAAVPA
ncbi:MAG TPA: hypothetical protein VKQ70_01970 [Caulobacteraceae bacterium]|jgi:hypothetical protein|nr:hypothetical protein [Caulobacteraceae bacterium]